MQIIQKKIKLTNEENSMYVIKKDIIREKVKEKVNKFLGIFITKIDAKCKRCDYEWKTKSKMWIINCSSCGAKVTLQINIDNDKKKKQEAKKNE